VAGAVEAENGYQDSLFTSVAVAQNVAKPLVKYIDNALVGEDANKAKVTLLVGHDSNIASLLTALDFKPYQLPGQYERTPIGGKLLFQRWHDSGGNRDLMKIEYVYQSTELRNADALTCSPRRSGSRWRLTAARLTLRDSARWRPSKR
jgi:glucose-1-phosphatase